MGDLEEVKKEVKEEDFEMQGECLVPKGQRVIEKDGWFHLFVSKEEADNWEDQRPLNAYCYFCDFSELTPHQHHIIRQCDNGKDNFDNLLPLCPNHHELIHKRKYILGFGNGFYFLKRNSDGKIIPPSNRQRQVKRKLPFSSINNNPNLKIEGDIETKAKVFIPDMFKRMRKKNSLIGRKRFKLSNKVCNE